MTKIDWHLLVSEEGIAKIKLRSQQVPCLIFKHSTSCNISAIAKYRLEDDWDFASDEMEAYYLDLLSFRPVSHQVAETFQVHHESPQVLLIIDGECVFDASHLDISVQEIHEGLASANTSTFR
jgi:bacillithiol system protein YtxJ